MAVTKSDTLDLAHDLVGAVEDLLQQDIGLAQPLE
jgi:hypothetical protein